MDYWVLHGSRFLGVVPTDSVVVPGQTIIFTGRRWLVKNVDDDSRIIVVEPSKSAMLPTFGGDGGAIHDLVRTGTSKTGRIYTYYTCSSRMAKGTAACSGNTISMPKLDAMILDALEEHLLPPERLASLLEALLARKRQFALNVDQRLDSLSTERTKVETALRNLYRVVESGDLGADDMLSNRILELRAQKAKLDATIERALANAAPVAEVSPEALRAFGRRPRKAAQR